jgi:hypothetical protein
MVKRALQINYKSLQDKGVRSESNYIASVRLGPLRWEEVDLETAKPALLVRRMLNRGESGRGCIVGASAKSGKGRRVRLTWPAVTALKDHRNRQLEELMRLDGLWQDYNEIDRPSTPPTCVTAPSSASRRASVRKDLHSMISAIRAPILAEGVTLARVGAAALSLALTGAVLLLRSSHPLTGATTLIVSLGLLQTPLEMTMLMIGVVILTVAGWSMNRALGVPMPIWSAKE